MDPNQFVDQLPLIYSVTPIQLYRKEIKNILIRSSKDRDFATLHGQLISEPAQNNKKVNAFSKLQSLTQEEKEQLLNDLLEKLTSSSIDSAIDWQNNLELTTTPPKLRRSSM